jgi:hypothetical protein
VLIVMRAFHASAHIIAEMANLYIGHQGDFGIGRVSNLFLGQVTNSILWGRDSDVGLPLPLPTRSGTPSRHHRLP